MCKFKSVLQFQLSPHICNFKEGTPYLYVFGYTQPHSPFLLSKRDLHKYNNVEQWGNGGQMIVSTLSRAERSFLEEGEWARWGVKASVKVMRYRLRFTKHLYEMTVSAGLSLPCFDLCRCQWAPGESQFGSLAKLIQFKEMVLGAH